jgi:hypothetical protein
MDAPATFANVFGREREKRMRYGVFAFSLGLVMAAVLMTLRAPHAARAVVLLPFFFGVMLLFQGLTGTCAGLAARGLRDLGDGPEAITNAEELAAVRRRARLVTLFSALGALAATAGFLVLP